MSPNKTADKIDRTRTVREAGGSTVITIPPAMVEFTEFAEGEDVSLEADLGGEEIVVTAGAKEDADD